mgnify:CR=1 FL=1
MRRHYKYYGLIALLILVLLAVFTAEIKADTDIDATDRYAWSDVSGWWDFYTTNNVEVGTSTLRGYAYSPAIGEIVLNCATTPNGDICSDSNFKVTNTDGGGNLSGCAWNDIIGWISFDCADYNCQGGNICTESNYQVTIDADGYFNGYAWNDVEGWISFNCSNNSGCSASDYKVRTNWRPGRMTGYLESSIIDTQREGGATLQSIIWQGTQPSGTSVDFQIAAATSTAGPWNYKGPDGTGSTWYGAECPVVGTSDPGAGPDKAICVDKTLTSDNQYLRYKVRLQSNLAQSQTPVVEDIVLNWSE